MKTLKLQRLGLQVRSLRGGGTVDLYERTQNIPLVCWKGRWQNEKSLVYYLQDALPRRALGGLPEETKQTLFLLERLYPKMINRY